MPYCMSQDETQVDGDDNYDFLYDVQKRLEAEQVEIMKLAKVAEERGDEVEVERLRDLYADIEGQISSL